MFTSLMRVLHEMLPCSASYFSMRKKYLENQIGEEDKSDRRSSWAIR